MATESKTFNVSKKRNKEKGKKKKSMILNA
uniref:Uncharacterized protein n=1 Tax=Anguilla anguilla TaxID=7936 RepID=A0A0E9QF52_ANGAN